MIQTKKFQNHITQFQFNKNEKLRKVQRQILYRLNQHQSYLVSQCDGNENLNHFYSVGLWNSFRHPEIMIIGLPERDGMRLLSDMQNLIKLGQTPTVGSPLGQGYDCYPVQLEPICDREMIRQFLPMADWFYKGDSFPVLQLLWSNAAGELVREPIKPFKLHAHVLLN